MMKNFSDDDEELLAFLRKNRPTPPTEGCDLELKLMELITKPERKNNLPLWTISGSLAASVLVFWGSYRFFSFSSQIAWHNYRDLEVFMINSWNSAIDNTSISDTDIPESEFLAPYISEKAFLTNQAKNIKQKR